MQYLSCDPTVAPYKDGLVNGHGPRDNLCPGSNMPPLGVINNATAAPPPYSQVSDSQSVPISATANVASASPQSVTWFPADLPLIKHIPKSARPTCAAHLAKLLRQVTAQLSRVNHWFAVLQVYSPVPKRGGKRHNLVSVVKKRTSAFPELPMPDHSTTYHKTKSDARLLAQAVSSKLEDGNLKTAIRILSSDDGPVKPSADSLHKLQEKHPAGSGGLTDLPAINPAQVLSVSEEEVRRAVAYSRFRLARQAVQMACALSTLKTWLSVVNLAQIFCLP